jgi:hypothetical protein
MRVTGSPGRVPAGKGFQEHNVGRPPGRSGASGRIFEKQGNVSMEIAVGNRDGAVPKDPHPPVEKKGTAPKQPEINLGRKVFFLYPHSVIRKDLLRMILRAGYEVYVLHDHHKALTVLATFPGSVMFVNIDVVLSEEEWKSLISKIGQDPGIRDARIGVVTYNLDSRLQKYYVKTLRIPCGFVHLKQDQLASRNIIIRALKVNRAGGIRKHIRAECNTDFHVTFYVKIGGATYNGKVKDISENGMACVFEKSMEMAEKQVLDKIHLNLRGVVCDLPGTVYARKSGEPVVYIILFGADMENDTREKICAYISANIQHSMDQKIRMMTTG